MIDFGFLDGLEIWRKKMLCRFCNNYMYIESVDQCEHDKCNSRIVFICGHCRSKITFEAEGKKLQEEFRKELDSWYANYIYQEINFELNK